MNSAKKKSQSIDAAGFKTFSKTVLELREEGRNGRSKDCFMTFLWVFQFLRV